MTNTDFRDVIQRSWQTLQKPMFREHVDRVGAAAGTVTEETFRNFTTVCEWALASDSTAVFMRRFGGAGVVHHGGPLNVKKGNKCNTLYRRSLE